MAFHQVSFYIVNRSKQLRRFLLITRSNCEPIEFCINNRIVRYNMNFSIRFKLSYIMKLIKGNRNVFDPVY